MLMLFMQKICANPINSCDLKKPSLISSITPNNPKCLPLLLNQVRLNQDPSFPPKNFESQKFHDNSHSFRYPRESQDVPPPQNVNPMHHPSMTHHPDPSNKMFLYKSENPQPFINSPGPKSDTFSNPLPSDFRPSRSRPSFSDNASLEMLYSFFSSNNF